MEINLFINLSLETSLKNKLVDIILWNLSTEGE